MRGRIVRATCAAAALAWSVACAGGGVGETPPAGAQSTASQGEALFRQHCASCHGIAGTGQGPTASALRETPADLTRIAARRDGSFPDAAVLRMIDGRDPVVAHGTREMPVWGERFGEGVEGSAGAGAETARRGRVLVIIEYLRSIQRPPRHEMK